MHTCTVLSHIFSTVLVHAVQVQVRVPAYGTRRIPLLYKPYCTSTSRKYSTDYDHYECSPTRTSGDCTTVRVLYEYGVPAVYCTVRVHEYRYSAVVLSTGIMALDYYGRTVSILVLVLYLY